MRITHSSLVKKIIPFFLLIVLTVCTYINSLNNDFVSDDTRNIANTAIISQWSNVTNQPLHFFQPLIFYIIAHTAGIAPMWFRSLNILLHFGNSSLIYLIGCALVSPFIALSAAALF